MLATAMVSLPAWQQHCRACSSSLAPLAWQQVPRRSRRRICQHMRQGRMQPMAGQAGCLRRRSARRPAMLRWITSCLS